MASYYQRNAPGQWGTNQFRFGAPPEPNFQPQPSWGGFDYYRARAGDQDPAFFNHAWNNVSRLPPGSNDIGVGIGEARHWHRRAYGGMGELSQMVPEEIGYAAAYEAYRTWKHYPNVREPLSADIDSQREALVGLACAEVTNLVRQSSRRLDRYDQTAASDAAAATAWVIFSEYRESEMYGGRPRSRQTSISSGYGGSSFDAYEYDEYPRHRRPRSRSASRGRRVDVIPVPAGQLPPGGAQFNTIYPRSSVPIPGTGVRVPSAYGGMGGYAGSYQQPSYGMMARTPSPIPMHMNVPISPTYSSHSHRRGRSASFSNPQAYVTPQMYTTPYANGSINGAQPVMMNVPMNMNGGVPMNGSYGVSPGMMPQPIMVNTGSTSSGRRKHGHKSRHSTSGYRSRSVDRRY